MRALSACVMVCVVLSCSPQGQPPDNSSGRPAFPIVVDGDPVPLFSAAKDAFAVVVSADRIAGTIGTVFNVTADVRGNSVPIRSYAWRVGAGAPFASDPSAALSLNAPGSYLVNVAVEDENGQSSSDGIELTVFDPSSTPGNVPSQITPDAGMPGTFVRIQSTLLNDPAADVKVMVGTTDPVEVYRPELGAANFLIPLQTADGLLAASEIDITLIIDGTAGETFSFTLSPLPALTGAPGELTRQWLEGGSTILAGAQPDLYDLLVGLDAGLPREEVAFLMALLHYATVQFGMVSDALLPLLDELDDPTLTMLDEGLLANGATPQAIETLVAQAKRSRTERNAKDLVLDQLCGFHELMDDVLGFIDAVSKGALAIPLLQIPLAASPVYPVLVAIANIAVDLGVVGDLLREVDRHVPRVSDALTVRAAPDLLRSESEKSVVHVEATLITQSDICAGPADLLAAMVRQATERIILNVPLARLAYLSKRRAFFLSDPVFPAPISSRDQFDNYVTKTLNTIAEAAIQATALGTVFGSLRANLCSLNDRQTVRLQPDPDVLRKIPAGAGNFLNLQAESIDFYCTLNDKGSVALQANRPCGNKGRVLTGETKVTCFGEECTEDASAFLEIQIGIAQVLDRDSPCTIVKETLQTRTASIQLRNTHPTRTIRVAGVSITQSDKRDLPRGLCEDPGPRTVEECLANTVGGCNSFAGFLRPDEVSFAAAYNCKLELLFPGSGLCGEMELETETTFWIWQAVFCDDEETAQQNFCPLVHEQMLLFGLPSPTWPVLERHDCP